MQMKPVRLFDWQGVMNRHNLNMQEGLAELSASQSGIPSHRPRPADMVNLISDATADIACRWALAADLVDFRLMVYAQI